MTRKAFLFVYQDALGTRKQIVEALDKMPSVIHWGYEIPNCFFIVSEQSAREILSALRETLKAADSVSMFVTEADVPSKTFGWLAAESWDLLQYKLAPGESRPKTIAAQASLPPRKFP